MPPSSKRRKLNSTATEEITFDFAAREEYLTGFHKRKQARVRHAQEVAAKKEKEERDREKRELRRQRREEVEAKVREVEEYTRKNWAEDEDGEGNEESGGDGEFEGFEDPAGLEQIDRMDEYIDEEKYAQVTVEDVDVSREGLVKARMSNGVDAESGEDEEDSGGQEGEKANTKQVNGSRKRVWTKEKPKAAKPKKKRKKFRYENKDERKLTRMKERSRNKAQAMARRG
jgi:ribosomal RNA-processing protein 17